MWLAVKPQKDASLCERWSKHGSVCSSARIHPPHSLSVTHLRLWSDSSAWSCGCTVKWWTATARPPWNSRIFPPLWHSSRPPGWWSPQTSAAGWERTLCPTFPAWLTGEVGGKNAHRKTPRRTWKRRLSAFLLWGGGGWDWVESATWSACKMLLQMGGRQTEWGRELFDGAM